MSARISTKHVGLLADQLAESDLFGDLADRASQLRLKAGYEPFSEYLWKSTQSQQQDALNSKFIQGIRHGNLDPTNFGGFMVQDSVYCYYRKRSIDTAAMHTFHPSVRDFLEKQSESYKRYYDELFKLWHIRDPNAIELSKACEEYAALEMNLAERMNTVYFLVALLPCYKLCNWLGRQLFLDRQNNFGVYGSWVTSNLNPEDNSYKKLEQLIDCAFLGGKMDKEIALSIFQRGMTIEANFFSSV